MNLSDTIWYYLGKRCKAIRIYYMKKRINFIDGSSKKGDSVKCLWGIAQFIYDYELILKEGEKL